MKVTALALALSLVGGRAMADGMVSLAPGRAYEINWRPVHRFWAYPRGERKGALPLDRWIQVAPGGGAVAIWSASTGLDVFSSSGALLWHRDGQIAAYRFSPKGDRLAVASAKGIEVVSVAQPEPRTLNQLVGIEWLRWIDGGLVAKGRGRLHFIDEAGTTRTLALPPGNAVVAASPTRVVYLARGALFDVDLSGHGAERTSAFQDRDPVINADVSPDGRRILFATSKRVYLVEGKSGPTKLADVQNVHSLFFAPDGSSFLWAAYFDGGAVVGRNGRTPLPPDLTAARFRQDGGAELVLTTEDGASLWDPRTGARTILSGGLAHDDGINLAADFIGGSGVVVYYRKTGREKALQEPQAVSGGSVLE